MKSFILAALASMAAAVALEQNNLIQLEGLAKAGCDMKANEQCGYKY